MMSTILAKTHSVEGQGRAMHKMPGHWLLAQMGKRVLRPGGLELTRWLLDELAVTSNDDVVEFAPGLGVTSRLVLAATPKSYTGVERDAHASSAVRASLAGVSQTCITGTAEDTGLPNQYASVVFGEAMLSMQPATAKQAIIREAARVLKMDGRYGIHELCILPDNVDDSIRQAIQRELSDEIHVGVRLLTLHEWRELLEDAGFSIVAFETAPMHLLEPRRLIKDEGLVQAGRFVWNVLTHSVARKRVLKMRGVFRKLGPHLAAVGIVVQKRRKSHP